MFYIKSFRAFKNENHFRTGFIILHPIQKSTWTKKNIDTKTSSHQQPTNHSTGPTTNPKVRVPMLGFSACAFQRGGLSKAIRELPERLPQAEVGVGGKIVGYMCIYIYMYVCFYMTQTQYQKSLQNTNTSKNTTYQKTTNHAAPFIWPALSFRSHRKSITKVHHGWIDHCSTTTTRSFRIDSTKELQRSTLISWRNDLIETSQAQLQKHHSFWRKFFCFFLKNTTDAIFAEQKMTNV